MSTTPTPAPATPVSVSLVGGTLNDILLILGSALSVLSAIPVTAPAAAISSVVLQIITAAVTRIESQTGKPIDLTQIPVETPLP
jgi:hypothetical protein